MTDPGYGALVPGDRAPDFERPAAATEGTLSLAAYRRVEATAAICRLPPDRTRRADSLGSRRSFSHGLAQNRRLAFSAPMTFHSNHRAPLSLPAHNADVSEF